MRNASNNFLIILLKMKNFLLNPFRYFWLFFFSLKDSLDNRIGVKLYDFSKRIKILAALKHDMYSNSNHLCLFEKLISKVIDKVTLFTLHIL